MSKSLLCPAVASILALTSQLALAQFNTFTSGGPPLGDGNDYPRSINPARQTGSGGATVGTFFTPTVGFTNTNGNPAFFDSNNLLTRPAALINGDAFWTDPRIGNFVGPSGNPFSIAQMGFEFYDNEFDSFGFDLAVASGSGTVPGALPFQVQDFDSDAFGFGYLVLDPEQGGEFGEVTPTESGTFFTLGGRQGREARYRIEKFEIEDLIGESLSGGTWFLDIDLEGIATLGGTTQIAIDNFVLNNAVLPMPTREPIYLPPTPPVGPNWPQYFNYAETSNDQSDGDSYEYTDSDLIDDLVHLMLPFNMGGVDPNTPVIGITFDGEGINNGLAGHVVTVFNETPEGEFWDNLALIQGIAYVEIKRIRDQIGPIPPEDPASSAISSIQWVLHDTNLEKILLEKRINDRRRIISPESMEDGFFNLLGPSSDDSGVEPIGLVTSRENNEEQITVANSSAAISPHAMHYEGYTVNDYIALKESLDEVWYEGDAGSFVSPVYGDNGEIETYSVSTWTVTSQNGVLAPAFLFPVVPEPNSLALVVLGFSAVSIRMRSISN